MDGIGFKFDNELLNDVLDWLLAIRNLDGAIVLASRELALSLGAVGAEFFGGFALIVGLLSRIAAAGLAIISVVAILMVHGRYGLFLNWFGDRKGHGYEYHLLAIAVAIVIIVRGSGALSLDHLLTSR
jgi:uncharacterized membrane protein YphA (DoxX/SURF4 family)